MPFVEALDAVASRCSAGDELAECLRGGESIGARRAVVSTGREDLDLGQVQVGEQGARRVLGKWCVADQQIFSGPRRCSSCALDGAAASVPRRSSRARGLPHGLGGLGGGQLETLADVTSERALHAGVVKHGAQALRDGGLSVGAWVPASARLERSARAFRPGTSRVSQSSSA